MNSKTLVVLGSLILCVLSLVSSSYAATGNLMLVHVDNPNNIGEAMANTQNYFIQIPQATVAMVFNGLAPILLPTPGYYYNGLQALIQDYDFKIYVCNNSLSGLQLNAKYLPQWAVVVPAGIVTIQQPQVKGYAYVRP